MRQATVTGLVVMALLAGAWPTACAGEDETPIDLGPADGEQAARQADGNKPAEAAGESGAEASPFDGGRIEGTIGPAERVKRVRVVDRAAGTSRAAVYDRKTGKFAAGDLPAGVWAVEVDTPWGRVEGVDMRYRPDALKKAAPKTKGDEGKPPPLEDEDRVEMARHVTGPERFMTARPLVFAGDGRHATVLVDLLRDRAFHGRKGDEVIWRLETWYYEDAWGHWERVSGSVIFRERLSGSVFRTWTRQFELSLGGLTITAKTTRPIEVTYTVPVLPTRDRGLVAAGQKTATPVGAGGEAAPPRDEPPGPADTGSGG